MRTRDRTPIFDLDGTLLDSDEALRQAFVELGVASELVTFGHVLADECGRLGLSVEAYLDAYDATAALPFDGIDQMVPRLERWAVCSNKHQQPASSELQRLGWHPDVVMFADAFCGPKQLSPVLDALRVEPKDAIFIGDTDHDRACAAEAGVEFMLAGWNPRALERARAGDVVAREPSDVLAILCAQP